MKRHFSSPPAAVARADFYAISPNFSLHLTGSDRPPDQLHAQRERQLLVQVQLAGQLRAAAQVRESRAD